MPVAIWELVDSEANSRVGAGYVFVMKVITPGMGGDSYYVASEKRRAAALEASRPERGD